MLKMIKYIQVYSERVSGTNYFHDLLKDNLNNIIINYKYGWKHGFPDTELIKNDPKENECLFIILVRNPFDWLRSMHKNPHHVDQTLKHLPFSNFIRTEWKCVYDGVNTPNYKQEITSERNPETHERFSNVIQLRIAKTKHFLDVKNYVTNFLLLRYEDIIQNPEEIIKNISETFGIEKRETFSNITTYKSGSYKGSRPFTPTKYQRISIEDHNYIKYYLDDNLEKSLNYIYQYTTVKRKKRFS